MKQEQIQVQITEENGNTLNHEKYLVLALK